MSAMYPDIDDNNAPNAGTPNYQATTNKDNNEQQKPSSDGGSCCGLAAKIWVTIIGILTLVLGLFVGAIALYAKFGYSQYKDISDALPVGGIWMIFAFGVVLAICSVLLIVAAHNHRGIFVLILVVFSIILTLLLLLEIAGAGVFIWGLGVITLPQNEVGNAISDRLLEARNAAAELAYVSCCLSPENVTVIQPNMVDPACLWPKTATAVVAKCGATPVFECVCENTLKYASSFGTYLQSNLMWVAIVTIVFAVLLLFGLIATCTLICTKDKKKTDKAAMYTN